MRTGLRLSIWKSSLTPCDNTCRSTSLAPQCTRAVESIPTSKWSHHKLIKGWTTVRLGKLHLFWAQTSDIGPDEFCSRFIWQVPSSVVGLLLGSEGRWSILFTKGCSPFPSLESNEDQMSGWEGEWWKDKQGGWGGGEGVSASCEKKVLSLHSDPWQKYSRWSCSSSARPHRSAFDLESVKAARPISASSACTYAPQLSSACSNVNIYLWESRMSLVCFEIQPVHPNLGLGLITLLDIHAFQSWKTLLPSPCNRMQMFIYRHQLHQTFTDILCFEDIKQVFQGFIDFTWADECLKK